MKTKKLLIIMGICVTILFQSNVMAFVDLGTKEEKNNKVIKTIEAEQKEDKQVIEYLYKFEADKYKLINLSKEIIEPENRQEEQAITKTIDTNKIEEIKNIFGKEFIFEDIEYKGTLKIADIQIQEIKQGKYEKILEKQIPFKEYSENELNNIPKESIYDGRNYVLIRVDWEYENTETIDNREIPDTYKGLMIYQTVAQIEYPSKYEVSVIYKGNIVEKITKYQYVAEYEEIIIEESKSNIVPLVIVSGLGIILALVIVYLTSKNVTVYEKTKNGLKYVCKYKMSNKNKTIDISKYSYKTQGNAFALKLRNNLSKKLQGKTMYFKINNVSKPIQVDSKYIEFIVYK